MSWRFLINDIIFRSSSEVDEVYFNEIIKEHVTNEPDNYFLDSFRRSLYQTELNKSQSLKFSYIVEVDGELAAKSEINFAPSDLSSYGKKATAINNSEMVTSLNGSFVHRYFRGMKLQAFMIQSRLEILKEQEYSYASAAVMENNIHSLNSLLEFGFEYLGEKIVDWGVPETHGREALVKIYGMKL